MRKVVLSMMVSLDGFIAASDGNLDWFLSDAEFEEEMLGLLRSVDGMLFGRVAYQLLAEYWPTAGTSSAQEAPGGFTSRQREIEFARLMNEIPKTVYSRTLTKASWGPVTIARAVCGEEIASLKRERGKDLVLFAGGDIASEFARQDLFDEYRVMIHPIVLGAGIPLFRDLKQERKLRLQRTRTFPSGVILLQYARDAVPAIPRFAA
ncbi:MAG: dihydrofolate reductase family protein [Steroidobacteraceae bacterium]